MAPYIRGANIFLTSKIHPMRRGYKGRGKRGGRRGRTRAKRTYYVQRGGIRL